MEYSPIIFILAFANIGVFGLFVYLKILERNDKK